MPLTIEFTAVDIDKVYCNLSDSNNCRFLKHGLCVNENSPPPQSHPIDLDDDPDISCRRCITPTKSEAKTI